MSRTLILGENDEVDQQENFEIPRILWMEDGSESEKKFHESEKKKTKMSVDFFVCFLFLLFLFEI